MKITKIKGDITSEISGSFKKSIAIDTEATGLQIPARDKLSLIQICDENNRCVINESVGELNKELQRKILQKAKIYETQKKDKDFKPYKTTPLKN